MESRTLLVHEEQKATASACVAEAVMIFPGPREKEVAQKVPESWTQMKAAKMENMSMTVLAMPGGQDPR
jgi:hypothetical protein